jgi:hypothetical protein
MPSSPDALIQAEATLKAACLHVAADLIIARKKIESSEEPEKAVAFLAMQIRSHIDKPSDWNL